jgi:predicted lipoprotein with Yx(FWY)xxD motif
MKKQRHVALIGTAVAVALFATGCGSDSAGGDPPQKIKPAGQAVGDGYGGDEGEGSQAGSKKALPAKQLKVKPTAKLGDIVTDSKGWTLYRFDDDTASPSQSNCDGNCAKAWPAVPAKDAEATEGISKSQVGKVKRSDGSYQLTLGGWPVYRYAKDTEPGDVKGHGVGKTWNALAPDGNKATGADGKQIRTVDNPELGEIVADEKGRTLYRFDKDSAWPMESNCDAECLKSWKPAKPVDRDKVAGVDPKLLTTFKRSDGTRQLTIDCWPLYWFTGDEKAGDINGQGKDGDWHAVTPDGKRAGASARN